MEAEGPPPVLPKQAKPWWSIWFTWLKPIIGLAILALVLSRVDASTLRYLAERASLPAVLAVTVVALGGHALGALRFKLLCDSSLPLRFTEHLRQYFTAACFNVLLPSSLGGDGVRLLMLSRCGLRPAAAGSLIVLERALGAHSLFLVAAVASFFADLPPLLHVAIPSGFVAASLGLALAGWLSTRWQPTRPVLAAVLGAAREAFRDPRRLVPVLVLSAVYQGACVLVTQVVNVGFSLGVPAATVFALAPLVWFVTLIPISLGGVGVREAGFVVIFGQAGVSQEVAVLLGLGTYAGTVITGVVGAVCFAWDRLSR